MVSLCHSVTFRGIDVVPVEIQVQLASGLPAFMMVGLPDKAVAESKERVRSAIHALGLALPAKRITVNLAPADLAKEGSHFDLPIALALLAAMGVVPSDALERVVVMGELSLDGTITAVSGVLPVAMDANARELGLICPDANGSEAAWAGDIRILAAPHLLALINHIKGHQLLPQPEAQSIPAARQTTDLKDVRGQAAAKRALEIAAAGGHNMLMQGPPGAGKSMLASCLPGLLPPLSSREMLEVSTVMSVAGELTHGRLSQQRPYRDPHHSSSMAAMVGGGRKALPGEISLAHHGVLFLDELPEFPRGVLEALRQPMEVGRVTVARAQAHVTYPAQFQLIAAMNPCRCGYLTDAERACSKAPRCAGDYQAKLSGPLLDRIDIHIDVPEVPVLTLLQKTVEEDSATVGRRVMAARERQAARYRATDLDVLLNARLNGEQMMGLVNLSGGANSLLEEAAERLRLSMRGMTRTLRVARTIADLAQSDTVERAHLAEAMSYRLPLAGMTMATRSA